MNCINQRLRHGYHLQTVDIAVSDYRDQDTRRLGCMYAEGMLRMYGGAKNFHHEESE